MSVSAVGVLRALQKNDLKIFRSADVMTLTGLGAPAAAQALARLAKQGLLTRVKPGLWLGGAARDVSAFELLPHLTAPWPSYVSLYSALSHYSLVEEVPHVVYGVTSGRPARFQTPLGGVAVHHLPGRLMWGYEMIRTPGGAFPMAEPEKAFLDLVYLSLIPRSRLEAPRARGGRWRLDGKKLKAYAKKFAFTPLEIFLKNFQESR